MATHLHVLHCKPFFHHQLGFGMPVPRMFIGNFVTGRLIWDVGKLKSGQLEDYYWPLLILGDDILVCIQSWKADYFLLSAVNCYMFMKHV